ncbi:hypothetical protein SKAU_G00091300 [Synaphobranchus kaupii]|uniref:Uncharacterized protein n=1 Tax=Synaphobranchus kaupii TaxID=118154 RepID=A0A9Q1FWW0_SYNKA|nr:hypothetical protein SKAU_G00091300 [Synaphobranchus kaupii]
MRQRIGLPSFPTLLLDRPHLQSCNPLQSVTRVAWAPVPVTSQGPSLVSASPTHTRKHLTNHKLRHFNGQLCPSVAINSVYFYRRILVW